MNILILAQTAYVGSSFDEKITACIVFGIIFLFAIVHVIRKNKMEENKVAEVCREKIRIKDEHVKEQEKELTIKDIQEHADEVKYEIDMETKFRKGKEEFDKDLSKLLPLETILNKSLDRFLTRLIDDQIKRSSWALPLSWGALSIAIVGFKFARNFNASTLVVLGFALIAISAARLYIENKIRSKTDCGLTIFLLMLSSILLLIIGFSSDADLNNGINRPTFSSQFSY